MKNKNKNKKMIICYLVLLVSFIYTHSGYYHPVDTLLRKENLSISQEISLNLIKKWQTRSYSDPTLNCQFYPSCSNFCAINIYNKGSFKGIILGTDRFLRCNEHAHKKHEIYFDGYIIPEDKRLSDNLKIDSKYQNKKPFIGIGLSLIPGMGKVYYGHHEDAKNTIKYISPFILSSIFFYKNDHPILFAISGSISLNFWISDLYGTYNIAKQYKKAK